MFTPIKIQRNKTIGSWSVALLHEESGKCYWIDVSLDKRWHELDAEWNQYIFYTTDHDDMERKEFQDNPENAEEAFDKACEILEIEGEVWIGDDGVYFPEPWRGEKLWMI